VGVASEFITRVPTFPQASVAEILDIRGELSAPLARFRAAVGRFATGVASGAHDADFAAEVADFYLEEVEPALQEIREAVESNAYPKRLIGAASAHSIFATTTPAADAKPAAPSRPRAPPCSTTATRSSLA
jgi:hypothetical protein